MKKTLLLLASLLSGCVVVSVPVDETLNALVSGTSELMSLSGSDSRPCTPQYAVQSVCIEYNRDVAIPELVPAIQRRLGLLRLKSSLHAPGAVPMTCEVTLRYTASREWGTHFTSTDLQPYLNQAELVLFQGGSVLSNAHYRTGRLGFEKWSSTESKMSSVVDDLMCKKVNGG